MRLLPPARVVVAVLACSLFLGLLAAPGATAATPTKPEAKLLSEINYARSTHGLVRLRMVWPLQRRAHNYAWMLMRRDRFAHAYLPAAVRENLALGSLRRMSARSVVRMWLRSPAHRQALLWPRARVVGIGVATGRWRGYSNMRIAVARFR